jgi:uncharacterized membrane protein YedE/YeeE
MTMTPSTPLKLGAVVFAVLWTLWMLWWSGSLDRINIAMLMICGAMVGYFWYRCMRWVFGLRFDASGESTAAAHASHGKIYPWIVWSALMVATGVATATLLDLVDPLIPSGEQHRLISALFIVVVWPSLMWCLPLLAKRRPRS